jgi:drug/metabolite transporter (DMT)-like permease
MSIAPAANKPLISVGLPLLFVVLWATGFVMTKVIAGHVAAVWFLALRFPLAALMMLVLALAQRAPWPGLVGAWHASVTGALLHALYLSPIYWAVSQGLPGGVSALFVALQPFFTAFLAAPLLGEKVNLRHYLGLVTGLVGVALVLEPKLTYSLLGGITPFTAGLAAFGVLAAALGTIYQKKYATSLALTTGGFWQYVGASIVTLLFSLVLRDFMFDGSASAWWGLAWAVVVLSVGTVLLLMLLINRGEVSRVSTWLFLEPATVAVMTYYLFNETLTPLQLLGMGVCALAVLMVQRRKG